MLKTILLIIILSHQSFANEENVAWQAWKKLEKVILANDEKQSLALLSGRMKEGFFKFGMESINNEVQQMQAKFVRELVNKAGNTRFVIVNVQGELRTLMFIKDKEEWLFDEQTSESYDTSEDAAISLGQFIAHQQLTKIYESVVAYCNKNNVKRIPPPKEMELDKRLLSYRDPATGKSKNIKIIRNVDFVGNSKFLLAVTENIIGAAHHAVFEDARIGIVSREKYKEHKQVLGIIDGDTIVLSEKEINKQISILGKGKSKERKAAREILLKLDESSLKYMIKHKESDDLETRLSIKEIIEHISKKSSESRPEF